VVVNDALGLGPPLATGLEGQSRRVVDRWWSGSGRARLNKAHRLRRIAGFGTRERMDQRVLGGTAVAAVTADPGAATSPRWSPPGRRAG
jgi:hypothetical protein